MAEPHTIETYGPQPTNRNIWSSRLADSFVWRGDSPYITTLLASQSSTADPPHTPIPPPPPSQSSLKILHPASQTEVLLLLNSLPNKQCELDPIPTSLLKDCASVLLPVITQIINLSLSTGNFPMAF